MTDLKRKDTKAYVGYAALHKGDDDHGEVVLVAATMDELEAAWDRYQGGGFTLDRDRAHRVAVIDGALLGGEDE